jgi:WD40 repeat protein
MNANTTLKETVYNGKLLENYIPYKGLMPYEEGDAAFFFGREKWRDIIIDNLRASRLTVLFGGSGVGKSSVLRAGVAYTLNKTARKNCKLYGVPKIATVVFNTWRDEPLPQLRQQIEAQVQTLLDQPELNSVNPSLRFDDALMGWTQRLGGETGDGKLFIILDQFEEYFLYHGQETEEGTFAIEFPRAVNRLDLPVHFLVSLRQDALYKLDRFKEAIPHLTSNRLQLPHLDKASASEAIRKPIREYNCQFRGKKPPMGIEPELIKAVLEQVRAGQVALGEKGRGGCEWTTETSAAWSIETPFLQMVMMRLWQEEVNLAPHLLRAKTLERLGKAPQIVKDHLDARMHDLTADEQYIAAHIFNHLVTPTGMKISQTVDDLVRYVNEEGDGSVQLEQAKVKNLLDDLSKGDARILRPTAKEADPKDRYEIFHDVLADAILDWRRRYLETEKLKIAKAELEEEKRKETEILRIEAEKQRIEAKRQRIEAKKQRIEAQQQQAKVEKKWSLILIVTSVFGLIIVGGLSLKLIEREQAVKLARFNLQGSEALVQLETGDALKALQSAMDLGHKVQESSNADQVPTSVLALQQILARIREQNYWTFTQGIPTSSGIAQSANGRWIVLGTVDGKVYRWDIENSGWSVFTQAADEAINRIDVSDDGQRIATATVDGQVQVWEGGDRLIKDFSDEEISDFASVRLSPDGKKLVVVAAGSPRLWDLETGEELTLPPISFAGQIFNVRFSPDSQTLAMLGLSPGQSSFIQLVDQQGHILKAWPLPNIVYDVRFRPTSQQLVTVSYPDNIATLWDFAGRSLATFKGHRGTIGSLSFSPDGQQLATGAEDSSARVWDLNGNEKQVLRGHDSAVRAVTFSEDGQALTTVTTLGTIHLWNVETWLCPEGQKSCITFNIPYQGTSPLASMTEVIFSQDGQQMVVGSLDGTASLGKTDPWIADSTYRPQVFEVEGGQPPYRVRPKAFLSADGQHVATIAADGTARVWSTQNETAPAQILEGQPDEAAIAINLATDPAQWVTVSQDGTIRLRDFRGQILNQFPGVPGQRWNAVLSPDNQIIAMVSGEDNIPRLWDFQGNLLDTINDHPGQVSALNFSPDGKTLAIGFMDGNILLWDVPGKYRSHAPIQTGSSIINVRFSLDGQKLVTASFDGTARLWNLRGDLLAEHRSGNGLWDANFSPEGQQLVAVGLGTQGWAWQVSPLDQLLRNGCEWMQEYLTTHEDERFDFCRD